MLDIKKLSYWSGKKQLLYEISLSAREGEITVLLGPNGAGKTTLLKTIMGLYQTPRFNQKEHTNLLTYQTTHLNALPVAERVALGLSYLAQQSSLFIDLSVEENLLLVFDYHPFWKNKNRDIFMAEMRNWLDRILLADRAEQKAGTLSGGQKRKLETARAFLMHPRILLLDEPFAGVDPKSLYELKDILATAAREEKIGILISDHHVDQLFSIANKVFVIIGGRVVTSGSIHDILNDEETKRSYLGAGFSQEMVTKFT